MFILQKTTNQKAGGKSFDPRQTCMLQGFKPGEKEDTSLETRIRREAIFFRPVPMTKGDTVGGENLLFVAPSLYFYMADFIFEEIDDPEQGTIFRTKKSRAMGSGEIVDFNYIFDLAYSYRVMVMKKIVRVINEETEPG